jgi:fluoroquinolone transport system ATP-binding protein
MSGLENLEFYRKLFDVKTRDPMELINLVGLDGKEKIKEILVF